MGAKFLFVWMICLWGQAFSQTIDGIDSRQSEKPQSHEQKFAELTSSIKDYTEASVKFATMQQAVRADPEMKQVFLNQIIPVLTKLSLEANVGFKKFEEIKSQLVDLNVPLAIAESKDLISQLTLSNMDRILFADFCWKQDLREISYDVAFNSQDKQRFGKYANEIKKCVTDAEKSPFYIGNLELWDAMVIRNLWSAYINYLMCYDTNESSLRYSTAMGSIVSMMTMFGESQVREWVTDYDRRKRWLEHPVVVGSYFFQQGKVDEAFAYFEEAGLMDDDAYINLCIYSGRFDKLIEQIQTKKMRKQISEVEVADYYALAFAAQQVGDDDLYLKSTKSLYDAEIDVRNEYEITQQIQRFLALSDMPKAMQIAHKYKASEDVFKLLCLSYEYDMAHQYVQVGMLIDPDGIKLAEEQAKQFFANINHPHAKAYDATWKPRSYKHEYQSPSDILRQAIKANEKLDPSALSDLMLAPEDKALELVIVEYLLHKKYDGSSAERKFLESHGKTNFLSEHYYQAWEKKHNSTNSLFLAGFYAKQSGKSELGKQWMDAACVMGYGSDSDAQDLINLNESSGLEASRIEALRKISRRTIAYFVSGRQCYDDAFDQKDYEDAARTWTAEHIQSLNRAGYSYGKHWWAWHNNAHDDEALGFLAIQEGHLDKAYEHLVKVRVVSENRYQLTKNLYFAYLQAGNAEKAQSIYDSHWDRMEKIYQQTPDYYWALSHLVRWSLACRNPMDGKALNYAIKLQEMRGDRYFESRLLAEHYVLNNQPQKAREILKVWSERRPRDKELTEFLTTLKLPDRTLRDDGSYFGAQAWF